MLDAGMTIAEGLRAAAAVLERAGLAEAKREARLVFQLGLGCDLAALIARDDRRLGGQAAALSALLARRAAREPISRIAGRREFYGLPLLLGPATLDPRQDTETLVDAVLAELGGKRAGGDALRLLDIGTGSGAILLALLDRLKNAQGCGTDIAEDALRIARRNAAGLGLADRAHFVRADLCNAIAGPFDIIASNPPYIASAEIAGLEPEVRLHDPPAALDGGADGLDFYRALAQALPRLMAPHGLVVLEVGAAQAGAVAKLLAEAHFRAIETRRDLAGIERVVLARAAGGAVNAQRRST